MKNHNKGQSFFGYIFLIVAMVGAIVALKVYLSRTIQEKYRQSADVWGQGEQYERGTTSASYSGSTWENKKLKCPEVLVKVKALEQELDVLTKRIERLVKEIEDLRNRAKTLQDRADEVEQQAQALDAQGLQEEAKRLRDNVIPQLLAEAQELLQEAAKREVIKSNCEAEYIQIQFKINELKNKYPQCFS